MMTNQVDVIVRATVTILQQHHRRQRGGGLPAVTVAIDDITILVMARTGLRVHREAIRSVVDALVRHGLIARRPGPRFMATTYTFTVHGPARDELLETFLANYHPRWTFGHRFYRCAMELARYEARWRRTFGGLPQDPNLIELAQGGRLNGAKWIAGMRIHLERRRPQKLQDCRSDLTRCKPIPEEAPLS